MGDALKDRVAIITGAGRGLGRAYALSMAAQGAKVVVNDLGVAHDGTGASVRGPADEVADEIRKQGGEAVADYGSVANAQEAQRLIDAAVKSFGRLDILVNNAGIVRGRDIPEMTDEEWDAVVKVHLYGTFYCLRGAGRVMRDQGYGRIINVSSGIGLGGPGQVNYASAKEAIIGLTRTAAREFARYGINVNAVRPRAATRATLSESLRAEQQRRMRPEQFERWVKSFEAMAPEAVAGLVTYLASEKAIITGCVFEAFANFVFIYADPPRIAGSLHNAKGSWSPEELAESLPRTLLRDYQPSGERLVIELMPDAVGWRWSDGELHEGPPVPASSNIVLR